MEGTNQRMADMTPHDISSQRFLTAWEREEIIRYSTKMALGEIKRNVFLSNLHG